MNALERLFGVRVELDPTPDELNAVEVLNEADYDSEPVQEVEPEYVSLSPVRVTVDPTDGYVVVARSRGYATAIADGGGIAVVTIEPPRSGFAWMIDRFGFWVSTGTYTGLVVYESSAAGGVVLDTSPAPPDTTDCAQPIWVSGSGMVVRAAGMTAAAQLVVNYQYRICRQFNEAIGL
jgi:hypothetical protein